MTSCVLFDFVNKRNKKERLVKNASELWTPTPELKQFLVTSGCYRTLRMKIRSTVQSLPPAVCFIYATSLQEILLTHGVSLIHSVTLLLRLAWFVGCVRYMCGSSSTRHTPCRISDVPR